MAKKRKTEEDGETEEDAAKKLKQESSDDGSDESSDDENSDASADSGDDSSDDGSDDSSDDGSDDSSEAASAPAGAVDAAQEKDAGASVELNVEEGDIKIDCVDCAAPFLFSKGEQDFYKEKGFDGRPVRCKECRAAKKARNDTGGDGTRGVCYAFQRGECTRGDTCRFSHSGEPGPGGSAYSPRGGRGGGGVCYAFQRGECTRGDSCRFLHEKGAAPPPSRGGRGGSRGGGRGGSRGGGRGGGRGAPGVCYAFQKGECTRGDSCRFSHESQ
eukprot:COSAG02_NODE_3113_length_7338_cov_2.845559_6_plen_272_part_00